MELMKSWGASCTRSANHHDPASIESTNQRTENQLTLGSLFVSADEQNPVLDSSGTTGVIGQTVDTEDDSSIGNYWLFIVASILLLAVWLCCFCCVSANAN